MKVTVRKKRAWRYLARFLMALDVTVSATLCWFGAEILTFCGAAALFLLMTTPMAAMLWHYERWSVTFSREGILWKGKLRPWTQVKRVRESCSATELWVISIAFRDGKVLRFRMEEENAGTARNVITRHCSIYTN